MSGQGGRRVPSSAIPATVGITLQLVSNLATGTVHLTQLWWPPLVWGVTVLLILWSVGWEVRRRRSGDAVASAALPETHRDRQPGSSPEPGQAKMQKEEANDHPPVVVKDLHGLDSDQIRLLRDSVAVLRDLLTVAGEAKRTSPLSQREFAAVSARMQSTLNRAETQFLALKGSVSLLDWPDREWAAKVITAREKAERGLKAAARWNSFGASDQQSPWPDESLTELLGLLELYSGLFTTEH